MQLLGILLKARHAELDISRITGHQTILGILHIFRAPEYGNDQIDHVAGLDQTFLDLLLFQLLFKKDIILFRKIPVLKFKEGVEDLLQVHGLGTSAVYREHIDTVCILKLCLFI